MRQPDRTVFLMDRHVGKYMIAGCRERGDTMKNAEAIGRKYIMLLYLLGLFGMFVLMMVVSVTKKFKEDKYADSDFIHISNEWTLDREGNTPVNLNDLGRYMDEETGVLSIYYQIPALEKEESLIYRSKDVYTKVLVEEELIYETNSPESAFYNRSPGNLWNVAKILHDYSGKVIEMQIYMVYDTKALTVDCVMWGDKAEIILTIIKDKSFGITVSMLMMVLGIVLMVADTMPVYGKEKKSHGSVWLGIFALLMGIWSIIETNAMQFIVDDSRILQMAGNVVMIVENLALLLYLDCEYRIFKNRLMRILGYLDAVYILACVFVQFTGIADLHNMLPGSQVAMVLIDIALFSWVIIKVREMIINRKQMVNSVLKLTGICALWISGLAEMALFAKTGDIIDRAEFVRIGMLIFITCLAVSSQLETYRLIANGMKFDIISSLAYSDGLTGLGNRTAYLEKLEEYAGGETGVSQLGIVFLDVNNLKKVNDNQGHEKGDEMITIASKIIADSFGKFGKAYRIGGDEFCVLMEGENLQENYEIAHAEFWNLIDEANKAKWYTYEVQIANGFSICDVMEKQKIDEAVMEADTAMYANKKMLKSKAQQAVKVQTA